ncbi:hypothetical protein [Caenimonas aquaedulcis]|uniref:Uncharacterized protein n=1 Tax=Caenimonas aquaedulcis TaxID=2793270 RepID=A0A931MFQ2_9BURK|nr:hypothetical protein [Caenimonas aquaedulcis]MBG9387541.1 hypothetical protein [Caenimonas aquaedulcis]
MIVNGRRRQVFLEQANPDAVLLESNVPCVGGEVNAVLGKEVVLRVGKPIYTERGADQLRDLTETVFDIRRRLPAEASAIERVNGGGG